MYETGCTIWLHRLFSVLTIENPMQSKTEKLVSKQKTVISRTEEKTCARRDGRYQMEKNRGITRSRKKRTKNPRKKYNFKHKKAVVSHKGQVNNLVPTTVKHLESMQKSAEASD